MTKSSLDFDLPDDRSIEEIDRKITANITDCKAMEIALRESEERFHQLVSNVPGGLFQFELSADGTRRLNYVSARFYEIFEILPDAVVGDIAILFTQIVPTDRQSFDRSIKKATKLGKSWAWEGRISTSAGEIKWIRGESRQTPTTDGAIVWDGILIDVTDRKQAERTLKFTQFAVDNSADGIAWIRPNGTFAYGNKSMCQMLGYSLAELCSLHVWDIDESASPLTWGIHWQKLRATGGFSIESEHCGKDGTRAPVEISINYFEFEGEEYNFAQVRNISNRKQAEAIIHQTNQRLEATIQELQQATRLKDEFLATMSHELRTPLNAILGMSEALQEEVFGTLNPQQLNAISTIEQSGEHLLSVINDILDVSKISAGKLALNITEVALTELCRSSLILVKRQAINKQIQIETHLPAATDRISLDERRMRQVLINLLNNAVKFTAPGGLVKLSVWEESISPDRGEEYCLCFAVSDTGIGISSADLSKLFQPFVQIDSSLSRKYQGTGLGLVLVKQIVELHGGEITVDSEVGKGSCFTVRLPQARSASERTQIPELPYTI
jgi:PAS domain S-box-containing protein